MKRLQEKISKLDFKKAAKRLLVLALMVVIVGGVLTGVSLRTQIGELTSRLASHETVEPADGESEKAESQGNGQAAESLYTEKSDRFQSDEHGWSERHDGEPEDAMLLQGISEPSLAAYLSIGATALLCTLLFAIYWLLVAAWLYKAAITANMNRALWPILGLFLNWAAVLLFFIFRAQKELEQA